MFVQARGAWEPYDISDQHKSPAALIEEGGQIFFLKGAKAVCLLEEVVDTDTGEIAITELWERHKGIKPIAPLHSFKPETKKIEETHSAHTEHQVDFAPANRGDQLKPDVADRTLMAILIGVLGCGWFIVMLAIVLTAALRQVDDSLFKDWRVLAVAFVIILIVVGVIVSKLPRLSERGLVWLEEKLHAIQNAPVKDIGEIPGMLARAFAIMSNYPASFIAACNSAILSIRRRRRLVAILGWSAAVLAALGLSYLGYRAFLVLALVIPEIALPDVAWLPVAVLVGALATAKWLMHGLGSGLKSSGIPTDEQAQVLAKRPAPTDDRSTLDERSLLFKYLNQCLIRYVKETSRTHLTREERSVFEALAVGAASAAGARCNLFAADVVILIVDALEAMGTDRLRAEELLIGMARQGVSVLARKACLAGYRNYELWVGGDQKATGILATCMPANPG